MLYSVECLREVYRRDVQRYTPFAATLLQHPVHNQMVYSLVGGSETTLVGWLTLVKYRSKSGT